MIRTLTLLFAFLITLCAHPASAQSLLPGGSNSSEVTLEETMRLAAEQGVSVIVIDQNGKMLSEGTGPDSADEEGSETSSLMTMQSDAQAFRDTLSKRLAVLPNSIQEVAFVLRASSPDGRIMSFVEALFFSILLFYFGIFVEREVFGKRLIKNYVVARIKDNPQGYTEKMPFLIFRFVMGLIAAIVSMIVAYVTGSLIFGSVDDTAMQFTIAVIYTGYAACRVIWGIWRMVLSPYLSQYRIPNFTDRDAKKLHRWLCVGAFINISGILFSNWISELGLNYDVYSLIASGSSLLVSLVNIALILFNRKAISNAILNGRDKTQVSTGLRLVSQLWAPFALAYVIYAWFELTYDVVLQQPSSIPLIAGAYGSMLSIIVVYGVINYAIERYFERSRALQLLNDELSEAETEEEADGVMAEQAQLLSESGHKVTTFEGLARRIAGVLALVAGATAFLYIWGTGGILSPKLVEFSIDVLGILFIGYIVYHVFRIWIDSKIQEEVGDQPEGELGDEGGGTSASRLATLLPLFRGFILSAVVVTIILILLLQLGINVSPLFAGAGVVGLAVGFGAQTLVRDIFSGAFFLFDDAFRKGEYIDIGLVKGTVEKISVRSFQLRHHLGALHTIPFGEIQFLTNYSRDWVIMKLKLRLTYDTDVEKVRKLVKKLGQELLEDPVIGSNFIQPLKSQGVIEMQDSAMIIRVKFMTKPGDQWLVRKRVYEEIRALFEREDIRFAHREVTVRLADEPKEPLTESQKEAVLAAAEASLDEDMLEEGGGDDR
jgi:small-conductance mechanosensitive channel